MAHTPFRHAHASHENWQDAVDQIATELTRTPPPPEALGFLFVCDVLGEHAERILDRLRRATGIRRWVGTVAPGVLAPGHDYRDDPAITVLVADWPAEHWQIFAEGSPLPADSRWWSALVFGDSHRDDVSQQISQVCAQTESGFIWGGLTDAHSRGTLPLFANFVTLGGGLAGVALHEEIAFVSQLAQSFLPLGGQHRVTESADGMLRQLDDRPALDVMVESMGLDIAPGTELTADRLQQALIDRRMHNGLYVAVIPPQVQNAFDLGKYECYPVRRLDIRHHGILLNEQVSADSQICFCTRDTETAHRNLIRMLTRLKDEIARRATPVRGGILISAHARSGTVFYQPGSELRLIREHLGDFPLAGFYSNGEILHDQRHTLSAILTLFF